jgi:hypothetical protein
MYRQGDLLIVPVKKKRIRERLRVRGEVTDNVLAYGEATGHAHRAIGRDVAVMNMDGGKFISANESFLVRHEEHDWIDIPPGDYRVIRQREYDGEMAYRWIND